MGGQAVTNTDTCTHPLWRYMSCGQLPQRHECFDCGKEAEYIPDGGVLIGHAPGECDVCDKTAELLPPEQKQRWIKLTQEGRGL